MTVGSDAVGDGSFMGGGAHARVARRILADMRHGLDLARLSVEGGAERWPDALLAELRFHLAGLLNAMELAIGLHLSDSRVEGLIGALGPGHCRGAIESAPGLLGPNLLAHLRRRAICAMLLRRASAAGAMGRPVVQSEALTALALAEQRWIAPMLLDAPMRPDLPAEPYHDLAWSVAALLIHGCEQRAGMRDPALSAALAQATERLVARHDEGQGVQALAQRCARTLPPESARALAGAALVEGRLLLFAALAGHETGLPIETVIDIMADGPAPARHAVMRLAGIEDAIAFRAAELLGPLVIGNAGDEALARFLERYRTVDDVHARAWLADATGPAILADKLAMLGSPR